ncbi:MAG: hypothetical protein NTZ35_07515 [Ignavibacteriales bacterium]|nr:hypothetical protein [Ignavibacteriales bacterium]
MSHTLGEVVDTNEDFLVYLKTRTHLYHQSNVFFRDFHYGIMAYGETNGKKISYGRAEKLAKELVSSLEHAGFLRRITPGSWMLNYPGFRKPSSKSEAASKPSSGSAVAKTAIATPSSGLASPSSSGNATRS